MAETQFRERYEYPKDASLSGRSYVPIILKEDGSIGRVPVAAQRFCRHVISVCPECVEQWQIDSTILFDRTAGGRRLKELMDKASPGKENDGRN